MRYIVQALIIATLTLSAVAADDPCKGGPAWNYCTCGACDVNGPDHWATVASSPDCSTHAFVQSPARITGETRQNLGAISRSYVNTGTLRMQSTARSIKFKPTTTQTITIGSGPTLTLDEFHFHFPAEHTLPARFIPALPLEIVGELHLVHRGSTPPTALAVFLVSGPAVPDNPTIETLIHGALRVPICGEQTESAINLSALVPLSVTTSTFLEYSGSLTTPDCSPVRWILLTMTISISQDQRRRLNLFGANSRPQANRTVVVKCSGPRCP